MQQRSRLTEGSRIAEIHRDGRSTANRLLVIRYLSNGLGRSRFCFVVSKRIGNAVARNLVKRRLREAVRSTPVKPGWDAVLIARSNARRASYQEIKQATNDLFRRTNLARRDLPCSAAPASETDR
jgi:ribonuclease P protein component